MPHDPNSSSASRAEYLARIHRVMDHVERHLDGPLPLEELARVACFSPFHFHRLFSAITGETLHQFILRLRLEKAATLLCQGSDESVTAVALDCGFGSSAAFARAFRASFGVTATEWRDLSRKKRQANRKAGQAALEEARYHPGDVGVMDTLDSGKRSETMASTLPVKEADAIRVETSGPIHVAYVRHVGPYAGNPELFQGLFGRLCQWLGPRGLIGPSTKFLTIYHDNPEITAPEKLRISVCATVSEGTQGGGEVGTLTIEGGKYVAAHFVLDPSEYGAAWNWLMGVWFPASGYQPDDRPCFELMLNDPREHPEGKHIVEIWESVKPL